MKVNLTTETVWADAIREGDVIAFVSDEDGRTRDADRVTVVHRTHALVGPDIGLAHQDDLPLIWSDSVTRWTITLTP